MSTKDICFVIMPFGIKKDKSGIEFNFDTVYEHIIKKAIEDNLNITCVRSDKAMSAGWIHKEMIEYVATSKIAIVDITTLNPNVFYELGVRHALKKNMTILIKKFGTEIPFNVHGMRVIDYEIDISSANNAIKQISDTVKAGINSRRSDSLVFDTLPTLKITL